MSMGYVLLWHHSEVEKWLKDDTKPFWVYIQHRNQNDLSSNILFLVFFIGYESIAERNTLNITPQELRVVAVLGINSQLIELTVVMNEVLSARTKPDSSSELCGILIRIVGCGISRIRVTRLPVWTMDYYTRGQRIHASREDWTHLSNMLIVCTFSNLAWITRPLDV